MKLNIINNIEQYKAIVAKYGGKECLTNDYLQKEAQSLIDNGQLSVFEHGTNVFFFVKRDVGLRVYYYLNDLNDFPKFDIQEDLIIEILFRGDNNLPQEVIDYFLGCGFSKHLQRDQYSAIYKNITLSKQNVEGLSIYIAKTKDEVAYAIDLFNKTFDNYTGNYIPESECDKLFSEKCILIARFNDRLAGAMHFRREGKLIWAEHNVVEPWCRGKHIGSELCNAFIEEAKVDDNTRYTRWTQHQGQAARMYEKMGFVYVNKSSFSMLKLNKNN